MYVISVLVSYPNSERLGWTGDWSPGLVLGLDGTGDRSPGPKARTGPDWDWSPGCLPRLGWTGGWSPWPEARTEAGVLSGAQDSGTQFGTVCGLGLGGLGLGLDVLEDCAPSAALLLLVGHDFPDSEALLATRGAHLPEAEHYMWAGGKWGCGLNG